jgi:hypothetical protein
MRLLFSAALFLSAALLFLVEPLFAKMVLPRFGGTPAVWNTCMVFFQAALLAGYAYAHAASRARRPFFHLLVLAAPALVLPIALPDDPAPEHPVVALLRLLLLRVGLPFFVVSTSGPLLQSWFARRGEKDPYFLYAASNVGSMLGLLAYPALLEPLLPVARQSVLWSGGYAVLVILTLVCGAAAFGREAGGRDACPADPPSDLHPWRKLRWIALAAVPSAQMLGVTTFMTTDVASVPLLWVLPLAIYLASFILVFSRRGALVQPGFVAAMPFAVLGLVTLFLMNAREPIKLVLPFHLVAFFVLATVCHGELAKDRPDAAHLTAYYIFISLGGLVGGTLTSLVAPFVFKDVSEYPLAVVAAAALAPDRSKGTTLRGAVIPFALIALSVLLAPLTDVKVPDPAMAHLVLTLRLAVHVGIPLVAIFSTSRRPLRFALATGALLLANPLAERDSPILYRERSFFGIHRVRAETIASETTPGTSLPFRVLEHGTTRHGRQRVDAYGSPILPREPLTYYHHGSPIGQAMETLVGKASGKKLGLVGLGAGTLAAYAEPGQRFTYFEIDPAVVGIAQSYFTYLAAAHERGASISIVLGDARLTLARSEETFDLLAIDAFSSDSIPLHLITREAIARAYLPHLANTGVLAFHISNRYLDLEPILGDLAGDAGLVGVTRRQTEELPKAEQAKGYLDSQWVFLARRLEDLRPLVQDSRWERLVPRSEPVVWTDDRSNILTALRR